MTVRNRFHSRLMTRLSKILDNWLDRQPQPRGSVLCGEAGVRLKRDPDTTVGIDVVYISAEVAARQTDETSLIDGIPTLAVEILSPSDVKREIDEKLDAYAAAGVPLVWIVNVRDKTVLVYRDGGQPELFNLQQELSAEPHLPGFRAAVADIFA